MKKCVALILALTMTLSLAACGGEPITLSPKSVNGLSVNVPSDFGEFEEENGSQMALNDDKTGVITVGTAMDGSGFSPADVDQDTFVQSMLSGVEDVEVLSFDNAADCSGTPAVIGSLSCQNSSGIDVTTYAIMLFLEDGTVQAVSLTFSTDKGSSLEENIDTVVKSVKIA